MKLYYALLFFLSFSLKCSVFSQEGDSICLSLCVEEAIWHYSPYVSQKYSKYYTLKYDGDTLINGILYSHIRYDEYSESYLGQNLEASIYLNNDNGKISYYHENIEFELMNFNLAVGDTMLSQISEIRKYYDPGEAGIFEILSILDSTSTLEIDGIQLKVFHFSEIANEVSWQFSRTKGSFRMVERIGFIDAQSFFGEYIYQQLAGFQEEFRCYEDRQILFNNIDNPCDTIRENNVGIEEYVSTLSNVYPNPSDGIFRISHSITSNKIGVQIFDLQGRHVLSPKIDRINDELLEINAGTLQPGMYIYALIVDGVELGSKRMIITD